jgi:hypothetical protein
MTQAPPVHPAAALAKKHAWPHAPQFATSLAVSTHWPLQAVCSDKHVEMHCPPVQAVVAGQEVPHAPQLALSDARFTHSPLQ